MFRNKKIFGKSGNVDVVAIVAIIVAVVGSVFFGLVLCLPDWYAYTFRCMMFVPLGYILAKEPDDLGLDEESSTTKKKVVTNLLYILTLTLLFLFFFGMVFPVNNLWVMALSSVLPFGIALFAFTNWKNDEVPAPEENPDCPYEVEKPSVIPDSDEDTAEDSPEEDSAEEKT